MHNYSELSESEYWIAIKQVDSNVIIRLKGRIVE